ncbi:MULTISPECIES: FdtA/QdtA family cupin domain-containing protein [Muribaculum]|jgi:oxalate decarboxylase/phosphoglucose isomerase-like protein (cupin superfamily)|uniref:WxcM-like domain-containing protein n=1 Tax=Muribaculum caecicola TaxID=3038144 RepID=A0AC61S7Q5_9BACT|nr:MULTISPECIES: FdtA/QdtA family cupin domain-containing protein [Muribaculum]THG54681.1 WxcM-like domain-containing protein [Muribaculum caecicola]
MTTEEIFALATVGDCRTIQLESHQNQRNGNLTLMQNTPEAPFKIRRIYYLYDIPAGESRGGHAHRELHEMLVATSGSFSVTLTDALGNKKNVMLNRPNTGLHIVPGIWRTLQDFSSGAVCLVLASMPYDENEYVRSYDEFVKLKNKKPHDNV